MQQSILQIPIMHKLINQQHPAPAALPVGGEAEDRDHVARVEHGGEEELVLKLALALEGPRVHELDCDLLVSLGKRAIEDGTEASLAEPARGGERVRGAAEHGVGEPVRRLGRVGLGGGPLARELAEADHEEQEEGESCGGGGGGRHGR